MPSTVLDEFQFEPAADVDPVALTGHAVLALHHHMAPAGPTWPRDPRDPEPLPG